MNEPLKIGTIVQCLPTPNPLHRKFAGTIHAIRAHTVRYQNQYGGQGYALDPATMAGDIELQWTRRYLRVIDKPDDGVADETLAWKPVPTTEEVTS